MPFIAWILVVYFSLSSLVVLTGQITEGMKAAKTAADGAAQTVSILLTIALYVWLVWAVVRLATT